MQHRDASFSTLLQRLMGMLLLVSCTACLGDLAERAGGEPQTGDPSVEDAVFPDPGELVLPNDLGVPTGHTATTIVAAPPVPPDPFAPRSAVSGAALRAKAADRIGEAVSSDLDDERLVRVLAETER